MKYKKYTGKDKYHFRVYRANRHHPFIVVMVLEEYLESNNIYLSGYMLTHNLEKAIQYRKNYIQLNDNPNPNDDRPCFLCKTRFSNIKANMFSKPYNSWHLSKKDELLIDILEQKNKKP